MGVATPTRPGAAREVESPPTARPLVPLKWWAALGAGFATFEVYLIARWVLSGHLTRVSTGVDKVPTYMVVAARVHEVLGVSAVVLGTYFFVVRPWRRQGRVPMIGLLSLGAMTIFWQDAALNWSGHAVPWNSAFLNFGSWYNFIPGWTSQHGGRIPQPILFDPCVYAVFMSVPVMFFVWCMRMAKERHPSWGFVRVCIVGFAAAAIADVVIEVPWCLLGIYSYAGALPRFTLFSGHYFQYPMYEALLWGGAWAAIAALVYFRDDRGNTLVERGIEKLTLTKKRDVIMRALALGAFMNLAFFGYNLAFGLLTVTPDFRWSKDVVDRSYLRGELCGPGTGFACPGADIPLPRGDNGSHVDEHGRLVVPFGATARRYN